MLELVKTMLVLSGDRRAVTALEYGLIAAAIAAVIAAAVYTLGGDLSTQFSNISASV